MSCIRTRLPSGLAFKVGRAARKRVIWPLTFTAQHYKAMFRIIHNWKQGYAANLVPVRFLQSMQISKSGKFSPSLLAAISFRSYEATEYHLKGLLGGSAKYIDMHVHHQRKGGVDV